MIAANPRNQWLLNLSASEMTCSKCGSHWVVAVAKEAGAYLRCKECGVESRLMPESRKEKLVSVPKMLEDRQP